MNRNDAIKELVKLRQALTVRGDNDVVQISDDTFEVYRRGYLVSTHYIARLAILSRNEAGRLEEDYMIKQR